LRIGCVPTSRFLTTNLSSGSVRLYKPDVTGMLDLVTCPHAAPHSRQHMANADFLVRALSSLTVAHELPSGLVAELDLNRLMRTSNTAWCMACSSGELTSLTAHTIRSSGCEICTMHVRLARTRSYWIRAIAECISPEKVAVLHVLPRAANHCVASISITLPSDGL
jgi:hypothetical protein